ncbi:MAG: hypothetical protein ACIWVG_30280 [Gloeotrichia echinulata HAB0833]
MGSEYIYWYDGTIDEFIEAAQALGMEYDYQKTIDGYDFNSYQLSVISYQSRVMCLSLVKHHTKKVVGVGGGFNSYQLSVISYQSRVMCLSLVKHHTKKVVGVGGGFNSYQLSVISQE